MTHQSTPRLVVLIVGFIVGYAGCSSTRTGDEGAPGARDARVTWTNGNKQGVGTAWSLTSKVWFTLANGVVTEVYYPSVDRANLRMLELIVTAGGGFFERESRDTEQRVEVVTPDALVFRQINTSRSGRYRITRTTLADPARSTVVIDTRVEPLTSEPLTVHVFVDPSMNNSGLKDHAAVSSDALVATEESHAMSVVSSRGFERASAEFLESTDSLDALRRIGRLDRTFARAADGNVIMIAEAGSGNEPIEFTLALGFATSSDRAIAEARATLARPVSEIAAAYTREWQQYLSGLERVAPPYDHQFAMAAMMLRAHEDKTQRGAMIASLTIPWGHEVDASDGNVGGYHLVWSRDLYHVALAFDAMGDRDAARRALDYVFKVQQRPDGSVPQNSWLDGRPFWTSLQLDEIAYPILLAHQLGRSDGDTYRHHIKPAANYLLEHGPMTPQERWEEERGYSPSTIAAEIAGLVAAAALADLNGDREAAQRYRATADEWARNLENWTVTRNGPHASHPYFVRITQHGQPNTGAQIELNNGAGSFDERSIVDAGFLELVRLGIWPADAPLITQSLAVVDRVLKVDTPNGPGWYRYNHDGYGEHADGRGYDGTGIGRLWPLLTGERGEYELAAGRDARPLLDTLLAFANEGLMLPEQVWDRQDIPAGNALAFGKGTGSATPLAWTNAGFIRLALGVMRGEVIGTPSVVRAHFARR